MHVPMHDTPSAVAGIQLTKRLSWGDLFLVYSVVRTIERLYCKRAEANRMSGVTSGVFQNIDPPPSLPGECVPPPPPLVRGEDTLGGWRGQYFGRS
jgi:hypothetical protein